jgi:hypothetical protein
MNISTTTEYLKLVGENFWRGSIPADFFGNTKN